ncbi:hypothetical protein EB796_022797 [Bugula neritina]|uniref:Uncharacterized protein n=1 Tax=Bugula neritina TaxID=10212 RepID=A0A7J7IYB6_BUGNE|nr:hypothetical protein EB796_022797 [Bugula neritina]
MIGCTRLLLTSSNFDLVQHNNITMKIVIQNTLFFVKLEHAHLAVILSPLYSVYTSVNLQQILLSLLYTPVTMTDVIPSPLHQMYTNDNATDVIPSPLHQMYTSDNATDVTFITLTKLLHTAAP